MKKIEVADLVGRPLDEAWNFFYRAYPTAWGYTGWVCLRSDERSSVFSRFPRGMCVEIHHDGAKVTKVFINDKLAAAN